MRWRIATAAPEETRGSLGTQIRACKELYRGLSYEPALGRLSELANIDPARTKGRQTDQKAATKLLRDLIGSVKPGKNEVQ